jgi:hypothetical protein
MVGNTPFNGQPRVTHSEQQGASTLSLYNFYFGTRNKAHFCKAMHGAVAGGYIDDFDPLTGRYATERCIGVGYLYHSCCLSFPDILAHMM